MKKGVAVELYFDPNTTARIKKLWKRTNSILPSLGAEPHLTLSLNELNALNDLVPLVERFSENQVSIDISLSSIGIFPTNEGVIYLAPVVTQQLLEVHARFHNMLRAHQISVTQYYMPDQWVPHVTIGQDVPSEQINEVIRESRRSMVFGPIRITSIGVVEYRPVISVCQFDLLDKKDR